MACMVSLINTGVQYMYINTCIMHSVSVLTYYYDSVLIDHYFYCGTLLCVQYTMSYQECM